jgi:hypothetical protein
VFMSASGAECFCSIQAGVGFGTGNKGQRFVWMKGRFKGGGMEIIPSKTQNWLRAK